MLRISPVGWSVSLFLVITYVICVLFGLIVYPRAMSQFLESVLLGFKWISWPAFVLGLVETIIYGWYVAGVFVPLYNYFSRKAK